jgi:hypothetical protein
MSLTSTLNRLANSYPESKKIKHVNISILIPQILVKGNNFNSHYREITFEYNCNSGESASNIVKDLISHGELIGFGYSFLNKGKIKILEKNIDMLIKSKDGTVVPIKFTQKKDLNYDIVLIRGKTKPKFTVTVSRVNSNETEKPKSPKKHRKFDVSVTRVSPNNSRNTRTSSNKPKSPHRLKQSKKLPKGTLPKARTNRKSSPLSPNKKSSYRKRVNL